MSKARLFYGEGGVGVRLHTGTIFPVLLNICKICFLLVSMLCVPVSTVIVVWVEMSVDPCSQGVGVGGGEHLTPLIKNTASL